MQIKYIGWIVILLLAAIIAGVVWYFLSVPKQAPQAEQQQPPVTLPSSGSVTQTSSSTSQTPQGISITSQSGSPIVTNDFIHNGVTTADPSNAGNYYLTGASTNGYAIGYRTPAEFFTIALEKEPLGQTRVAAESFLLAALGISQSQLCSLNYYVGTDVQTNSFYAGKNLGFSFCPGATVLPQ
jgi:hypothetical protein